MLQADFEKLVTRLEALSTRNPVVYKVRLILFAALGYLYIALITVVALAALTSLPLLLLTGKGIIIVAKLFTRLGIPLLLFLYTILRSLWVRFEPPSGTELNRKQAPELFSLIDRLRREMKTPHIHQVMIDDELNACVAQIPRLGFFGWYKNYMVIGLPYLLALSPEQLEAVLAHELGHISRYHGRMGGWIYRTRRIWLQLSENLDKEQHWGSFIFRNFFDWFAPRFSAYSFVMARSQEYEADRLSALFAGKEIAASSLVQATLLNQRLQEDFWSQLDHLSESQPSPINFFQELTPLLTNPLDEEKADTWLQTALSWSTDCEDTHPCLADRLQALKVPPVLPQHVIVSAAITYLGEELTNSLAEQFTSNWQAAVRSQWTEQYQDAQRRREELKQLRTKAMEGTLTADERVNYALLAEHFEGLSAAMPIFIKAHTVHSDYAPALYHYGRVLLEQNNEQGIDYIIQANENAWDSIIPGATLVCSFLLARDKEEEASAYWVAANERWSEVCLAKEEREELQFTDLFIEHDIAGDLVMAIDEHLRGFPEVTGAYLVKKAVKHLPEYPLYILLYEFSKQIKDDALSQLSQNIIDGIDLPGEYQVVPLTKANRKLKKIKRVPNSLVYRKE